MSLLESRLVYTKGMRAALQLLLDDPRVQGDVRAVVEEHHKSCEAVVTELEGKVTQ